MEFYLETKGGKFDFIASLIKLLKVDVLPVFVCIGSDRVVSDMVGPLTAEFLVNKFEVSAYVYGRLKNPIVASNLNSAIEYIKSKHKNSQVVIIDASLGDFDEVGKIKLNNFGCVPAGVFNSNNIVYGDVSILPIISTYGINEKLFLSCAKFNKVYEIASNLAACISKAVNLSLKLADN